MATPAQYIEQLGAEKQAAARDRQNALEDEQRKVTLKTLQEDSDTPADKVAAIQAVYHRDPGVLKQHVENLTRRMTGKPTQPVVSPDDAQQARIAPIAARGKTPDQQALEFNQKQGDLAGRQKLANDQAEAQQEQQNAFNLIDTYIKDPEQNKAAKEDFVRKQAGIQATLKNIPGAAGQPVETAPGSGKYVRPVQGADGTIAYQPMPEGWKPPAPKAAPPRAGVSHGKPAFAILTDQGWVDPVTKKTLNDFQPAPNYAQVAGSLRPVPVVDPNDPSSVILESAPEAIRKHAKSPQSIDYKLQMPTGQERGRAQLANSALEQLDDMKGILSSRSDLFGPVAGRKTDFTVWVGSQDPDAQRFRAAAQIAADHLAGVFGGRSQAALKAIYDVVGKNTTNPAAAIAGLEQMGKAAGNIKQSGGGPAPKNGGAKEGDTKVNSSGDKVKFHNGQWGPA